MEQHRAAAQELSTQFVDIGIVAVIESALRDRGQLRAPRLYFKNPFDIQLASIYGEKDVELQKRGRNSHRFVQNQIEAIAPEKGRDELSALSASAITAIGQKARHTFTVATVATSVAYHPVRLGAKAFIHASLDVVDQMRRAAPNRKQPDHSFPAWAHSARRLSDEARDAFLEMCHGVRWSQVQEVVKYAATLIRNHRSGAASSDRPPLPAIVSEIRSSSAGQSLWGLRPSTNSPDFLPYQVEVSHE